MGAVMGIRCDGCTRQAEYVCVLPHTCYIRFYCVHHRIVLLQRAAAILHGEGPIDEFVHVERLASV